MRYCNFCQTKDQKVNYEKMFSLTIKLVDYFLCLLDMTLSLFIALNLTILLLWSKVFYQMYLGLYFHNRFMYVVHFRTCKGGSGTQ